VHNENARLWKTLSRGSRWGEHLICLNPGTLQDKMSWHIYPALSAILLAVKKSKAHAEKVVGFAFSLHLRVNL
jgi:hypothetical protein